MSAKEPMRGPSVPGKQVDGPHDLVMRMNEATSDDWDQVPLPARQQLGWHEEYEVGQEHAELKDYHGVSPEELHHSTLLSGSDQDSSLNLTQPVTYHLESTPPPAEPAGAPGSAGYNNANRGVPAAEDFDLSSGATLEQSASVRTYRLPEGVGLSEEEQAKVDGTGPYVPGQPMLSGDARNVSDTTRAQSVQTASVNDPYRNPDGSLKDPAEVQKTDLGDPNAAEYGSKEVILGDAPEPVAAVDTEGAQAEPDEDAQASAPASDVPDGSVGEVLKWVGDDKARARAALEAETAKGDDGRSSLIGKLNGLV
jgi:hypothetical protein